MARVLNKWEKRYTKGLNAHIDHSFAKEWRSPDKIPPLDDAGCSAIVMRHQPHMHNPVGIDRGECVEWGFFHAQAGKHGAWYVYDEENGVVSMCWVHDGWKPCDRPEPEWEVEYRIARERIERGDWAF